MRHVSVRDGFSDRNCYKPENKSIQIKELDERTRIQLHNMIMNMYHSVYMDNLFFGRKEIQSFIQYVIGTVYSAPVDTRRTYNDEIVIGQLYDTIINAEFDEVLTLIEALIQYWDSYLKKSKGYSYYNAYTKEYKEPSLYEIV